MLFDVTEMSPPAPEVPETRLSIDPAESVSTLALMPTPDALIVAASLASVLLDEFSVMVNAVPLPAFSVTDPDSGSLALAICVMYPLDVVARFPTSTVCVPATAAEVAAVRFSTLVSELEPSFCARMPVALVSELISLERLDNSVPRLEIAVSWLCNVLS